VECSLELNDVFSCTVKDYRHPRVEYEHKVTQN